MTYKNKINSRMVPTPALEKICINIVYILTTTLVFEGLVRKLVPGPLSLVLFFLKDAICIVALLLVYNKYSFKDVMAIKQKWIWLSVALIPSLILTFFIDPPLAAFAAKQYLLYAVVILLVQYSFFNSDTGKLYRFLAYFSFLLLPTAALAMLQNASPATAWINLGVEGNTLENFSAAGYLRVSSTFSFTGQYSWFLNISCPLIITFIVLSFLQSRKVNIQQWLFWILLVIAYIISIFITGGRTAVLGAGATISLGFFFLLLKRPFWVLSTGILILFALSSLLGALKAYKPEYFAAYEARSSGSETETHQEEVENRVSGSFTDWTYWFSQESLANQLMGNGLGVMSNGADQLSKYARGVRRGFWTETDTPTIFWEGGIYLALIWYSFRLYVIFLCFRTYWSFKEKYLNFAGAFLMGYISVTGIMGTLSIQPPLSIWWWLAVGVLISLKYHENTFLQKQGARLQLLKQKLTKEYMHQ